MNRRPSSFRSLAAVATADAATNAAAMSYRPHFRGGRPQYGRGYCGRPDGPATGERPGFVSGDSHFSAVRDANRGFRASYNAVPPPPQYAAQQLYRPRFQRPGPPTMQAAQGPGPRPGAPASGNYQQFRPRPPQQFRPRPAKPPDYREWEYRKLELPSHCERFTILSYNILGDYLASEHWHKLYFHIPRYMMDWNWRKKNIIFELGLWSADILCFQEVDRFHDIEAELKPHGYSGIWKMRTGDPVDGCAIFWRVSRFKLISEEYIEYNKLGLRDNVAQICVFEKNSSATSTLSTSSESSKKVVVCNIHVLFNPKRGEIKLGQIRVLLERANAVSKLWDDAPVVLCGDFNCTPKSPMYNFIKEMKLDLSELARDMVSGQASAEIGLPRPAYSAFRPQGADNFTASPFGSEKKLEQGHLPSEAQKLTCPDISADALLDSCATRGLSTPCAPPSHSVSGAEGDIESPLSLNRDTDGIYFMESSSDASHVEATKGGEYVQSDSQTLTNIKDNQIERQCLSDTSSSQLVGLSESSNDATLSKHLAFDMLNSASTRNMSVSSESRSADTILDQKFEALSLGEEVVDGSKDKVSEDCESFLSELRSAGQNPFSTDGDSNSRIQKLHNKGDILNQNLKQVSFFDMEKSLYNPSAWTPVEIETATGSANCRVMEHPLKLTSAYTEVESSPELRDSSGEPFVTSYHKRFSGTVDYIWHSQGLETVKVLAPIGKHVMHQTGGFPTKKWGSDHIALVSEFAFTKDISPETPKQ